MKTFLLNVLRYVWFFAPLQSIEGRAFEKAFNNTKLSLVECLVYNLYNLMDAINNALHVSKYEPSEPEDFDY